jgi:hypothetical protein
VLGFGLTATVVSLGTFVLCTGCAGIVWRRERHEALTNANDLESGAPRVGRRLQLAELVVPFGAVLLSMLIALASLSVFPRKAPDDFNSMCP